MLASKQLFFNKFLAPIDIRHISTSDLISNGVFCFFEDPATPIYMPIGQIILDKLTALINDSAKQHNFCLMTIPQIIKNDILNLGVEIEQGFLEKMLYLSGGFDKYHLLFTPEPVILMLAKDELLSYRQLPIRVCFHGEIFRAITDTRGILKTKQFKTFMGTSIDRDLEEVHKSLKIFEEMTSDIFNKLDIPIEIYRRSSGINTEFFYFGSEGEPLDIPEMSNKKVSGLSLAMTYHYGSAKRFLVKFQDSKNKKSSVMLSTYGLGTQRVFYSLFDSCRDDYGFNFSSKVRPFDYFLIPKSQNDMALANRVYEYLFDHGVDCFFDDRLNCKSGKRAAFSDYLGVPIKLYIDNNIIRIISRGIEKEPFIFLEGDNYHAILNGKINN